MYLSMYYQCMYRHIDKYRKVYGLWNWLLGPSNMLQWTFFSHRWRGAWDRSCTESSTICRRGGWFIVVPSFLSIWKAWTVNQLGKLFEWIVTSRSAALFDGVHISILLPRILLNTCITHSTNVIVFPVPEITKNVYHSLNITRSSYVLVSLTPSKQSIMIKTMYCDKHLCGNQKL